MPKTGTSNVEGGARRADRRPGRAGEPTAVLIGSLALSVFITWPLASGIGYLGRVNSGDAQFSIWNVAWVARTIVTDPAHVYDANIYYPHRGTLAYSEANLGSGVAAVPVYWLTRNPYAAHNVVFILAFAAAFACAYRLARRLSGDRGAAAIAAILFACCPYLFAHTAHIQLVMAFGMPLSMLALHRVADAPSAGRGVALGAALALQALFCAYYGIFAGLMVGYGVLFFAVSRGLWRSARYWIAVILAAGVAIGLVLPFFMPYVRMQGQTGFNRTIEDARAYSANATAYFASAAHAHRWMLPWLKQWKDWSEVLFPGYLSVALGLLGLFAALSSRGGVPRERETAFFYASLGVLAFWASFGPAAGLYSVLFHAIPVFSFLRAPSRMGIVVVLSLSMLAAIALGRLLDLLHGRARRAAVVGGIVLALAELNSLPLDWRDSRVALPIAPSYAVLAGLPKGPVVEFPFFDRRIDFYLHTRYMLYSTAHWMPLVNGYSDNIPVDFRQIAPVLAGFPSGDSFAVMRERRVRYIVIHRNMYGTAMADLELHMRPFRESLKPVANDAQVDILEIVSWPK